MKNLREYFHLYYNTLPLVTMFGNPENKKKLIKCEQNSSISSNVEK